MAFPSRDLAFAHRSTKEVVYKTLVRPKLEYAASILSPYCKTQIQQVEKDGSPLDLQEVAQH